MINQRFSGRNRSEVEEKKSVIKLRKSGQNLEAKHASNQKWIAVFSRVLASGILMHQIMK